MGCNRSEEDNTRRRRIEAPVLKLSSFQRRINEYEGDPADPLLADEARALETMSSIMHEQVGDERKLPLLPTAARRAGSPSCLFCCLFRRRRERAGAECCWRDGDASATK